MRPRRTILGTAFLFAIGSSAFAVAGAPMRPEPIRVIEAAMATTFERPDGAAEVVRLRRGADAAVSKVRFAPGLKVPSHSHETEREMLYVLSGGGSFGMGSREWDGKGNPPPVMAPIVVGPGDFLDIPAGRFHDFTAGLDGCEALQIYLPGGPDAKYDTWAEKGTKEPEAATISPEPK